MTLVRARVCSSTCLTITAQYSEWLPSRDGREPGTTTAPAGTRPRIIATTDGEIDDRCSMVRFLLYANEWDVEGIIHVVMAGRDDIGAQIIQQFADQHRGRQAGVVIQIAPDIAEIKLLAGRTQRLQKQMAVLVAHRAIAPAPLAGHQIEADAVVIATDAGPHGCSFDPRDPSIIEVPFRLRDVDDVADPAASSPGPKSAVNAVLARTGSVVCARSLSLPGLAIATCMRVEDSLADGTSLFMAELERLKAVVEASSGRPSGGPIPLFLLDEILHGTNTAERQVAARTVLGTLVASESIGAVSTVPGSMRPGARTIRGTRSSGSRSVH